MKRKKNVKSIFATSVLLIFTVAVTACKSEVIDEEKVVKVDASVDEITYRMEEISKGDVIKTQAINCSYVQTKSQEVTFATGGKIVDKVYVREGDSVKKGDLLVELESGNIEEEIAELEYNIAKTELQYGYLDTYKEFELQNSYYNYVYGSKMTEEDFEDHQKLNEEIEESYRYQKEDYEDTLYFDKKKLSEKQNELSNNRVYASMDGTVIKIKNDLKGSTAKRDDVIMTVVDSSNGLFETEDETIAAFMQEDTVLPMNVVYGDAKGDYELTPYEMQNWGEKQTFQILERPEGTTLEVGTSGTIVVTVDQKMDVLRIPREALYEAEGRFYAYTLDEDNMRQVRFLEIGLVGDKYAEVLGGIEEAEKVIKK